MLMVVQNNSVFVKEPPADEKETIKFSNEESQEVESKLFFYCVLKLKILIT